MEAVVLVRRDFREHDQVITVLTRDKGMLDLVARGIKKSVSKNSSTLQECALVELEVAEGKQLDYVTKAQPLHSFVLLRTDLERAMLAQFAIHTTTKLLQTREAVPHIFDLLVSFLYRLESEASVPPLLATAYGLKLCAILGFAPALDRCVISDSNMVVAFSPEYGGVLSPEGVAQATAERKTVISLTTPQYKFLRSLLYGTWEDVGEIEGDIDAVKDSAKAFIQYASPVTIQTSYEVAFV